MANNSGKKHKKLSVFASNLSLTLHFNGHFPGEPGLASVY